MEEEVEDSKWQDRISSGFERLVAFASTELDKRRRSTEGSDSCNTSPDSGIGHGDPPPPTINVLTSKQNIKINQEDKPAFFKAPFNKKFLESLPVFEQSVDEPGPPRTPSPVSSVNLSLNYNSEYNAKEKHQNSTSVKYQRHVEEKKSKPDQHFKKKFYYREQWRDEVWQKNEEVVKNKFRPKGKDWMWHKGQSDFGQQSISDGWNPGNEQYTWKN